MPSILELLRPLYAGQMQAMAAAVWMHLQVDVAAPLLDSRVVIFCQQMHEPPQIAACLVHPAGSAAEAPFHVLRLNSDGLRADRS